MKTIKNPWYNSHNSCSREYYTVGKPILVYNGYELYKLSDMEWLYTLNGEAVTLRAGASDPHKVIGSFMHDTRTAVRITQIKAGGQNEI